MLKLHLGKTYPTCTFLSLMNKVKLEFTLNNRRNTYFRRFDLYGKPLITTNVNSARTIKESDISQVIKRLMIEYGKDNVKDIKPIKG